MTEAEKRRVASGRPVNKATMDAPQEEFVADESMPSHSDAAHDREHGSEVDSARRAHAEEEKLSRPDSA